MIAALPEGSTPLAIGTLLALAALSLVLWPLLGDDTSAGKAIASPNHARLRQKAARDAAELHEIEFDRETGKLSESDYAETKLRLTQGAHGAAASLGTSAGADDNDPVEAAIRRARARQKSCVTCGPRTEPDATYCSNCGRYLADTCGSCHAPVREPAAAYCSSCGESLSTL